MRSLLWSRIGVHKAVAELLCINRGGGGGAEAPPPQVNGMPNIHFGQNTSSHLSEVTGK